MWGQTTSQGGSRADQPHFESVWAGTWQLRSHIGLEEDPMPESQWKPAMWIAARPSITSKLT
jgi:hypothetical protein